MESHSVVTEDGYVLGLHRIPYSLRTGNRNYPVKKKVVLFQHGLMASDSLWLVGPTDKCLGNWTSFRHGHLRETWLESNCHPRTFWMRISSLTSFQVYWAAHHLIAFWMDYFKSLGSNWIGCSFHLKNPWQSGSKWAAAAAYSKCHSSLLLP